MEHPSSHKTTIDISGDSFIFCKMWICLACFLRPGSCSVAMCNDFVFLQYASLSVMLFDIINGDIVLAACFSRCVFAPESDIYSVFLLQ